MNEASFMVSYRRYYQTSEEEFLTSMRYVELSAHNYGTHSISYATQLLNICSIVEAVFKMICGYAPTDEKTITAFASYLIDSYPGLTEHEVTVLGLNDQVIPFGGWDKRKPKQSLFWWSDYQEVKHSRETHFFKANLKNVLYALAALYLLECYLLRSIRDEENPAMPNLESKLFSLPDQVRPQRPPRRRSDSL